MWNDVPRLPGRRDDQVRLDTGCTRHTFRERTANADLAHASRGH